MNEAQLEQKKKILNEEMIEKGYGWVGGIYTRPPARYEKRYHELWCIDMINSILCYDCRGYEKAEEVLRYEERIASRNYLSEYVKQLGRNKVLDLIQGQIDSISKVEEKVFVDEDGFAYHSIIWKEQAI